MLPVSTFAFDYFLFELMCLLRNIGGGAVRSKYVADIYVFKTIFIVIYLKGGNLSLVRQWRLIA